MKPGFFPDTPAAAAMKAELAKKKAAKLAEERAAKGADASAAPGADEPPENEPDEPCAPCPGDPMSKNPTAGMAPPAASYGRLPPEEVPPPEEMPSVCLVIGMAGCGKTSLMQRVNAYLHSREAPPYVINLDPAVTNLPYDANVDIRDTVNYKAVMKEYNLGPNGAILTAANLFATRFDQVVNLCERRAKEIDHIFVDTPGQIEIFTWSASGAIVSETFASAFPTCILYVMDTVRSQDPQCFMSNMLQAVSILYKFRLPMVLVFNKIDVVRHETQAEWMTDFEKFHAVLDENPTFASDLSRSMSLVLDEFYKHLRVAGVSAMTGEGMEGLFEQIERSRKEYLAEYLPELNAKKEENRVREETRRAEALEKLRRDAEDGGGGGGGGRGETVVMDMKRDVKREGSEGDDGEEGGEEDDEDA